MFSMKKMLLPENWVSLFLTTSHERGCKPTVNPLNTRGPGFSHGIANSTVTLDQCERAGICCKKNRLYQDS